MEEEEQGYCDGCGEEGLIIQTVAAGDELLHFSNGCVDDD